MATKYKKSFLKILFFLLAGLYPHPPFLMSVKKFLLLRIPLNIYQKQKSADYYESTTLINFFLLPISPSGQIPLVTIHFLLQICTLKVTIKVTQEKENYLKV